MEPPDRKQDWFEFWLVTREMIIKFYSGSKRLFKSQAIDEEDFVQMMLIEAWSKNWVDQVTKLVKDGGQRGIQAMMYNRFRMHMMSFRRSLLAKKRGGVIKSHPITNDVAPTTGNIGVLMDGTCFPSAEAVQSFELAHDKSYGRHYKGIFKQ